MPDPLGVFVALLTGAGGGVIGSASKWGAGRQQAAEHAVRLAKLEAEMEVARSTITEGAQSTAVALTRFAGAMEAVSARLTAMQEQFAEAFKHQNEMAQLKMDQLAAEMRKVRQAQGNAASLAQTNDDSARRNRRQRDDD